MDLLAKEISEALEKDGAYKVHSGQIARLWPMAAPEQETELRAFAGRHGWILSSYTPGSHAIITKPAF